MRLTTVILIATLMQVSAAGFAQRITLTQKKASLEKIFREIHNQTGYDFLYDRQLLNSKKPIDINITDGNLEDVLKICLEGQLLEYRIEEKTVVIKEKTPSFPDKVAGAFAVITVRGRVLDEQGRSIPGATVRIKDGKQAIITDASGAFALKNVSEGAVLQVSFIGYKIKELPAAADMGDIRLEVATSKLDEVQIMAYGQVSHRLSTGNITTVSAKEIEKQPVNNPLLALEGMVPGLVITQSTGFANSGVTVRIQGQNSILFGNDPLYVIDGVPYPSALVPTKYNAGVNGYSSNDLSVIVNGTTPSGNPLSFINPASIESIDILKDADATAIYGSRAANGAILITTKKGKAGQTRVDVNMQSGWGQMTRRLDLLNTQQYLEMRKEAYKNDGLAFPPTVPSNVNYDLTVWDPNRYTDWQKVLLGGTAAYTDAQASVSGGTTNTQFLVGAGYHKETTVFPGDFDDRKGSLNFSLNNVSTNQKFRIQFTGSYLLDDNLLPGNDLTDIAMKLQPNAPALYNPDGSLNWAPLANGTSTWKNPVAYVKVTSDTRTNNLLLNSLLSYQILPGLYAKANLGYTDLRSDYKGLQPISAIAPEIAPLRQNYSQFGTSDTYTWSIEPQLTYTQVIGKGTLDVLLGGTLQQTHADEFEVNAKGFGTELLMQDLKSATVIDPVDAASLLTIYKYNALFGRTNYNLADKYILNLTVRRDGSSHFGADDEYHTFGSIGGAWIFSNETLVKNNLSFLSFGKLRGSYGTTGSDQIGNYLFLSQYQAVNNYGGLPYQGVNGLEPAGLANPHLAWELTRKFQAGLELGFFKDRVLLNADYFLNRTSNELLLYTLPAISGVGNIPTNLNATVQNSGWELSLNTVNIQSSAFKWSSAFNITVSRNKLLSFPDLENSTYSGQYVIGQPLGIFKAYHYLGVDPATGLYMVADKNGKPTASPDPIADRTVLLDFTPKYYGGFQNSFGYKGLQLTVFIQFSKQMGFGYKGYHPGQGIDYWQAATGNQPVSVLKRWHNPGDVTNVQRFSAYGLPNSASGRQALTAFNSVLGNGSGNSDIDFEDASYIRLKNVSLSWALPQAWIKTLGFKNCKLFVQGQNLLTITGYSGLDPETRSSATLPPLRVVTLGVQAGL